MVSEIQSRIELPIFDTLPGSQLGSRTLGLYNLADDIGGQHDVADEHPEVVKRIVSILTTARIDSELFPKYRQAQVP